MEPHLIKLPFFRPPKSLHSFPKIILFSSLILLTVTLVYLYDYPSLRPSVYSSSPSSLTDIIIVNSTETRSTKVCDITRGEWIPDPEAPYYTNMTCRLIQEHQNCMKYGRPNMDFLKWRWRPEGCELPRFDPTRFLELVRGKSLAFVGDSLARNHMQSLMCLLSQVDYPEDISETKDENFKSMFYTNYNLTISIFWSPFLIKAHEIGLEGQWNLYLDEADDTWTSRIEVFDHVIISCGNWFSRISMFYENRQLVGCHFCQLDNVTDLTLHYSHRMALRTAFKAINKLTDYKGTIILRTTSPSHFENGEWNRGGNCGRTRPFQSNETRLEGRELDQYKTEVEEFREAERVGRTRGHEFRLMDTTGVMQMRPDGHPSRYGHWAHENVTLYNDCVHWCLPGPIDTWNDILLQIMSM